MQVAMAARLRHLVQGEGQAAVAALGLSGWPGSSRVEPISFEPKKLGRDPQGKCAFFCVNFMQQSLCSCGRGEIYFFFLVEERFFFFLRDGKTIFSG